MQVLKNEINSIINDTFINIFGNDYTNLDFDEDGFDEALNRDVKIDFHLEIDFDKDNYYLYINTYYDNNDFNSEIAHTTKSSIMQVIDELLEIIEDEMMGIQIRIDSKTMNKIYRNEEAIKTIKHKLIALQAKINDEIQYI